MRAFDLLEEIGRDCVGAVQLLDVEAEPPDVHRIDGEPLDEAAVARELRATTSASALGQRAEDPFRISLAGAQEKTAFTLHEGQWCRPRGATPTTHIFKLPLGTVGSMQADLSTSVENEWLCAKIVDAFGEQIAPCEIAEFEDQRVLVVERFDRRLAPDGTWWIRLPQEDLCQATGRPPGRKYEADGGPGVASSMALLLGARTARADRLRFFRAQVLFWMLAAPDGHAKNFSVFLEPAGAYSLTPLYDVMSAYPILGRHHPRITRRHWFETAKRCGLGDDIDAMIDELVARTPRVVDRVGGMLPPGFPASVAEPVLRGVERAAESLAG